MLKFIPTVLRCFLATCIATPMWAQMPEQPTPLNLKQGVTYKIESQVTTGSGHTPLWLQANRYGLSSLEPNNAYLRAAIERPLNTDTLRHWGVGYGLDVVGAWHFTSKPIVQQAYAQLRWLNGTLTVGSKQIPMELRNPNLSSGAQTLGMNARPVPQVRIELPEYWVLPFTYDWIRLRGHIAYGMMTDGKWQRNFTQQQSKFSERTLFHSKAGYLMIGNPERFYPLSLELGLEMATLFGGTSYNMVNGQLITIKNAQGPKSFIKALLPGGSETIETGTNYENAEGDILGSWVARINYETDTWRLGIYADKFFEDHSSMLQLDYDGYGDGTLWNNKINKRYLLYDFKDIMLGVDLNLKYGTWLRNLTLEYLYTKYQSGPIYHDHTVGRSAHVGGRDDFYNHYIFSGWQHWGQVMGNPLYRSPLYNDDHTIEVRNNRFVAFHLGIDGRPTNQLAYRVLATYQEGLGTYSDPFVEKQHNLSLLLEAAYTLPKQWNLKAAAALDMGHVLGNNRGLQLTITKTGLLLP